MKNILFATTFSILATFAVGEDKILGKDKKEFTILGKDKKEFTILGKGKGNEKKEVTIVKGETKFTLLGKGKDNGNQESILEKGKNEFTNLGNNQQKIVTDEEETLELITAELEIITAEKERKELEIVEEKPVVVAEEKKKKRKKAKRCPVTPKQQFAEINTTYRYINENQQYFEKKRSTPKKLPAKMEHGEAIDYFDKNEKIVKRKETYLSKESKFVIEYLLQDGELRYILTSSGGKMGRAANRHFFYCGKMIKWLDKKRKPVSVGSEKYRAKEKELLANYPF